MTSSLVPELLADASFTPVAVGRTTLYRHVPEARTRAQTIGSV